MAKAKNNKKRSKSTTRQQSDRRAKPQKSSAGSSYVASVILFAVAVLTMLIAIIRGNAGWTWLHSLMHGLFGITAYIWPVLLGYIAVLEAQGREQNYINGRLLLFGSLLVLTQTTLNSFAAHPVNQGFFAHLGACYTSGSWLSGGAVGGIIGYPLWALLDWGSRIVLCIVMFVMVMLITGTTLIGLYQNAVRKPTEKLRSAAGAAIEQTRRRREQRVELEQAEDPATYDIPIDGEERRSNDGRDLSKTRSKLIRSYHDDGRAEQYDITVDDQTGEVLHRSAPNEQTEAIIDDALMTKINEAVEVISDGENQPEDDAPFDIKTEPTVEPYRFPPVELLHQAPADSQSDIKAELTVNADKLVSTLRSFGVETKIIDISRGPSVTRYELQPAAGVKISKITSLADDIALNLASAGVRIEAPIPNKAAVGIEVPNRLRSTVSIRELIDSDRFRSAKGKLNCVLGRDISGELCMVDISKMPHLLIAGTTGSGKSVCLNSLIVSILYRADPSEVKMLMIDPKAVEMKMYNGIPHLLVPIVSDPRKAAGALGWAVTEMLQRYKLMSDCGVKNLEAYNRLADSTEGMERLPQIVIFIDELADLMMAAPNEVEDSICRLAQMARAAGMHLIIATQRPSVNVITGLIKANVPSRIALTVSSSTDSRIILDMTGAERLIGRGDMLFAPIGSAKPTRIQGCWVSDDEIESIVEFLKGGAEHEYDSSVMDEIERQAAKEQGSRAEKSDDDQPDSADEMLPRAIECVVEAGQASTSLLQRKLKLGYARAARIVDQLEERGIVGPYEGSKPRRVLMTRQQWLESQALGGDDTI